MLDGTSQRASRPAIKLLPDVGPDRMGDQPASRESARGVRLPARYAFGWREFVESRIAPSLKPGVQILDVGSGRQPTVPPPKRPEGCRYVGLDVSLVELRKAPKGSYDEQIAADAVQRRGDLQGRFDLVVSWQALEHVKPLDVALDNFSSYLRPGGSMVALLSGSFSLFGIVNKLAPARLGVWGMQRLLGRDPESVFPAYYDRCYYSALVRLLESWSRVEVVPLYRGAAYFRFSRRLQALYLAYEGWAMRRGHHNLATHYLIDAQL